MSGVYIVQYNIILGLSYSIYSGTLYAYIQVLEVQYSVLKPHTVPNRKRGEKIHTPKNKKESTPGIEPSTLDAQGVKTTCYTL